MSEKICVECGRYFDSAGSSRITCDDECKAERLRTRQTSISSRFIALQRILRDEKIYWQDDRHAHSERFYEGLLSHGCIYCEISLESFTGVCLDRIDNKGRHNSWNVAPCCPTCNRLRSDEFNIEEARALGQVVKNIRDQRESGSKKKDLYT